MPTPASVKKGQKNAKPWRTWQTPLFHAKFLEFGLKNANLATLSSTRNRCGILLTISLTSVLQLYGASRAAKFTESEQRLSFRHDWMITSNVFRLVGWLNRINRNSWFIHARHARKTIDKIALRSIAFNQCWPAVFCYRIYDWLRQRFRKFWKEVRMMEYKILYEIFLDSCLCLQFVQDVHESSKYHCDTVLKVECTLSIESGKQDSVAVQLNHQAKQEILDNRRKITQLSKLLSSAADKEFLWVDIGTAVRFLSWKQNQEISTMDTFEPWFDIEANTMKSSKTILRLPAAMLNISAQEYKMKS